MSDLCGITCGDCNASDPEWASLNRGILLCKDCCYVHRTLGPQFTRVKSLKHSQWHPNLKKMLYTLASGAANHVWEYTLLIEPSKVDLNSKPLPNEPVETRKRKFITSKHFHCQFIRRQKSDSLNSELHSTVRTSDIGTSLRLLASGGDPNYFHPILGTRILHVAARSGQALQVELLFLYGAQTDGLDYLGQTPVEHALAAGHKELALRLLELRYHLTDQLSYFVCSQVPDHSTTKHIIIPRESKLINGRKKQEEMLRLQLPLVLEQFAGDLYDEVDRRELEGAMLGNSTGSDASKYSVAFLPVHSYFPSVRNQTRQKFARLTNDELASLITFVLIESKRRHCNTIATEIEVDKEIFFHADSTTGRSKHDLSQSNNDGRVGTQLPEDDEFPLYDSVASDDDLNLTEEQTILPSQRSALEVTSISSSNMNPISNCETNGRAQALSAKIIETEIKVEELKEKNYSMKLEITVLHRMVSTVINENLELRKAGGNRIEVNCTSAYGVPSSILNGHNGSNTPEPQSVKKHTRPLSMVESRVEKTDSIGIRPSSAELYLRKKQGHYTNSSELVQDTTKKVVELIKVLIEQANRTDTCGIQSTCAKIYEETQQMTSSLMQEVPTTEIKETLKRILFEVLRMNSEILVLVNNDASKTVSKDEFQARPSASDLVQKVKQNCFDVGAAMKQLVSIVLPQN